MGGWLQTAFCGRTPWYMSFHIIIILKYTHQNSFARQAWPVPHAKVACKNETRVLMFKLAGGWGLGGEGGGGTMEILKFS